MDCVTYILFQHIYAEGVFGTAANISIYVSSEYDMLLYSQTFD